DSPRFSPPRFRFAWRVRPAGVESILRYSTGEPFLFEKKLGEGHIIVMTSSPDPRFTDLFRKTIFAPLITSATFHVAAAKVFTPQSASVGDELRFRVNSHLAGASFEMRRPDDLYDRLSPRLEGGSALLAYDQTDQPGIYRLYADRALLQQWAVNLPVEESVLAGLPQEELEKRFGIKWIPPQADLAVFIAEQRRGIELWRWFAGLALLLLIVEMLLYREKGEAAVETAGEMHA
ncbi:MAG: hypothetical protein ONA69_05135, partial [candidate division KSB1 bacterium]|nr:hypothetical protein [candidate division KSB1 bacterium]